MAIIVKWQNTLLKYSIQVQFLIVFNQLYDGSPISALWEFCFQCGDSLSQKAKMQTRKNEVCLLKGRDAECGPEQMEAIHRPGAEEPWAVRKGGHCPRAKPFTECLRGTLSSLNICGRFDV